ncbi:MAG: peptidoglycan/LPS O-acetylase OafA/YrhL [Luteibaculaceae bacterium]|jgi:peptidoglycan/LPS O-acetylase OafA/YrhL
MGVDVFFLLSGFLITYILLREKGKFGRIHIRNFIIRRTIRIWPLYYLLICIAPFLVEWVNRPAPNYLANALFLGNFDMILEKKWVYPFTHFWSICIEEHFYLLWPLIVQFVPLKQFKNVCFGIILFSIAGRFYFFEFSDAPWYQLFLNTISRMDVLVVGALGAYFHLKNPINFKLSRFIRLGIWVLLIFLLGVEGQSLWNTAFLAMFKKYVLLGLMICLLLDYNFNKDYKHRFPFKKTIKYLGKISYGIYMYSNMLLIIIIQKCMWPLKSQSFMLFGGFVLVLSLGVPIISYEVFEKHTLKLNKRFRRVLTKR